MKRRARVDANQPAIVKVLRQCGCSVQSLASVGKGCPDLLVGHYHSGPGGDGSRNYLFEVKDPDKPPSARRLTPDEKRWHECWEGQVHTIETAEEALRIMGIVG